MANDAPIQLSSSPSKASHTNVGIGGSPWRVGGAGGGGAVGFAATKGTSMCIGDGGTIVAEVVEGLASEGIFCFFKSVPLQSIH